MCAETNTGPKLCECGCGEPAPISKRTYGTRLTKGQPARFIAGHNLQFVDQSTRSRSQGWKGGRSKQGGRTLVYVGRDHPMAYTNGYVFEHRLVMAAVIGRFLASDEHVHHIDLDPTNNAAENLVLVTRSQHTKIHRMIQSGSDPAEALTEALA